MIDGHQTLSWDIEAGFCSRMEQIPDTLTQSSSSWGDVPIFVEVGEAGIVVENAMRHRRSLQLHLRRDLWRREQQAPL